MGGLEVTTDDLPYDIMLIAHFLLTGSFCGACSGSIGFRLWDQM